MTHVIALDAAQSSQGTYGPITPVYRGHMGLLHRYTGDIWAYYTGIQGTYGSITPVYRGHMGLLHRYTGDIWAYYTGIHVHDDRKY